MEGHISKHNQTVSNGSCVEGEGADGVYKRTEHRYRGEHVVQDSRGYRTVREGRTDERLNRKTTRSVHHRRPREAQRGITSRRCVGR